MIIHLIDDDSATLMYHEFGLKKGNSDSIVKSFLSATEYLDFISSSSFETPNLVLIDINMPVMNGLELIKTLEQKHKNKFSKSKIYIVSSSLHFQDVDEANSIDILSGYFQKNISIEKMKELTKTIIE